MALVWLKICIFIILFKLIVSVIILTVFLYLDYYLCGNFLCFELERKPKFLTKHEIRETMSNSFFCSEHSQSCLYLIHLKYVTYNDLDRILPFGRAELIDGFIIDKKKFSIVDFLKTKNKIM